jgi:hypothetical protein
MATTGDRLTTQAQNVTVQKGSKVLTPPARTRPTTPAEQEVDTVQVWPHLVVIEFLGAIIITINLVLVSTLFNGPLLGLANPERTPNPSKAPWYFLNLQELLLHMNPALAGVIVPTVALGLIAIIPYVDRNTRGLGVWWYSDRGKRIVIFSTIYTTAVTASLIYLDKATGTLKSVFTDWLQTDVTSSGRGAGMLGFLTSAVGGNTPRGRQSTRYAKRSAGRLGSYRAFSWSSFPALLVFLLKMVFKGIDLSEIIIAFYRVRNSLRRAYVRRHGYARPRHGPLHRPGPC